MYPSNPVCCVCEYAEGASEYCELPSVEQRLSGVIPLDTLPAAWWNAMWHDNNASLNQAVDAIGTLIAEANTVLECAGVCPNSCCVDQLYSAINIIRSTYGNAATAGAVKSSSSAGNVAINNDGTMTVNCYGNAALTTTAQTITGAINELNECFSSKLSTTAACPECATGCVGTSTCYARADHQHPLTQCICICCCLNCCGSLLAVCRRPASGQSRYPYDTCIYDSGIRINAGMANFCCLTARVDIPSSCAYCNCMLMGVVSDSAFCFGVIGHLGYGSTPSTRTYDGCQGMLRAGPFLTQKFANGKCYCTSLTGPGTCASCINSLCISCFTCTTIQTSCEYECIPAKYICSAQTVCGCGITFCNNVNFVGNAGVCGGLCVCGPSCFFDDVDLGSCFLCASYFCPTDSGVIAFRDVGTFAIEGDLNVQENNGYGGDADIGKNLRVQGTSCFGNNVCVDGNLKVDYDFRASGNAYTDEVHAKCYYGISGNATNCPVVFPAGIKMVDMCMCMWRCTVLISGPARGCYLLTTPIKYCCCSKMYHDVLESYVNITDGAAHVSGTGWLDLTALCHFQTNCDDVSPTCFSGVKAIRVG